MKHKHRDNQLANKKAESVSLDDYAKNNKGFQNKDDVIEYKDSNQIRDDLNYLTRKGVSPPQAIVEYDLNTEAGRKGAETSQILTFRKVLFWVQSLWVMIIIPSGLVAALLLPVYNIELYKVYAEQKGMYQIFFAALTTNIFGMYLIIIKYLFPSIKNDREENKDSK
jgi:hypothetical protein